jgi:hypothetical protein
MVYGGASLVWQDPAVGDENAGAALCPGGEGISKSSATDMVEAILAGRADQGMMLEPLERPLPASWEEQRHSISSSG